MSWCFRHHVLLSIDERCESLKVILDEKLFTPLPAPAEQIPHAESSLVFSPEQTATYFNLGCYGKRCGEFIEKLQMGTPGAVHYDF